MSEDGGWKMTLVDRLTSLPVLGFIIVVLGAVLHKLDVGVFGGIGDVFVRIIHAVKGR